MLTASDLRKRVSGPHNKIPWSRRLFEILSYVGHHPESASEMGVMSCDPNAMMVNTKTMASFLRLASADSCNHNLRQHGFQIDAACDTAVEMQRLGLAGDRRCWTKRTFRDGTFNPASTAEEIAQATKHARWVRGGGGVPAPAARAPVPMPMPEAVDAPDATFGTDPVDTSGGGFEWDEPLPKDWWGF
jgi:hypothetical protein